MRHKMAEAWNKMTENDGGPGLVHGPHVWHPWSRLSCILIFDPGAFMISDNTMRFCFFKVRDVIIIIPTSFFSVLEPLVITQLWLLVNELSDRAPAALTPTKKASILLVISSCSSVSCMLTQWLIKPLTHLCIPTHTNTHIWHAAPPLPVFALFSVFFMGQTRQADAIISTRGRVRALFWSLGPRC